MENYDHPHFSKKTVFHFGNPRTYPCFPMILSSRSNQKQHLSLCSCLFPIIFVRIYVVMTAQNGWSRPPIFNILGGHNHPKCISMSKMDDHDHPNPYKNDWKQCFFGWNDQTKSWKSLICSKIAKMKYIFFANMCVGGHDFP